jgi:hypothetical protein
MTVEELKAVLVGLGFPKSELNKLNKDSLMELHANAMEDQVVDNVNLDADFEEVNDSPELEIKEDEQEGEVTPSVTSEDWHEYVMSQFKPNELIDGNPITAGLRRVVEVVLGEVIETGPVEVFPATDPNGPGRATVIYRVVLEEYESGRTKSYSDTADVWHGNTDDLFCAHPVATACTRAEGRALRKALKLRVLAAEELAKKDIVGIVQQSVNQQPTDGEWNPDEKVSPQQINFIDNKCSQLDIDVMKFVNSGSTSYPSINNVTKDTAKNMIVELNKYQNQTTNIPPEVKGYVSNWRNN